MLLGMLPDAPEDSAMPGVKRCGANKHTVAATECHRASPMLLVFAFRTCFKNGSGTAQAVR